MKTILTETFSIIKVSLFWALALPAAAIIFPVAAGWERLNSLISRGPIISRSFASQQLRPAARQKFVRARVWMIAEFEDDEFLSRVAIRPIVCWG